MATHDVTDFRMCVRSTVAKGLAMSKQELEKDPEYVQGQIDSLYALVLAIAGETMTKEDFLTAGTRRLEGARVPVLNSKSSDARLKAIDVAEVWLKSVVG